MTLTEQEKKIIEDALYELLYNVKKEEEQLKKIENKEIIKTLNLYEYKSNDVRNLLRKII